MLCCSELDGGCYKGRPQPADVSGSGPALLKSSAPRKSDDWAQPARSKGERILKESDPSLPLRMNSRREC